MVLEKYLVQVIDENDIQYGAKSNVQGTPNQSYEIPSNPRLRPQAAGDGLPERHQSAAAPPGLGAIVILAAGIFWSLWAVRELMKKTGQSGAGPAAEHAFRQAMEDSLTVGMRAWTRRAGIVHVNPAFCRMTGIFQRELVGMPPMPYCAPPDRGKPCRLHRCPGDAPQDGF